MATGRRKGLAAVIGILALGACRLSTDAPKAHVLAIVAGDAQTAPAGTVLPVPLGVIVIDQYGFVVENVTVTWEITLGGGSLSASSTKTDSNGVTSVSYTAGPTAGTATITATVTEIGTLSFTATIT